MPRQDHPRLHGASGAADLAKTCRELDGFSGRVNRGERRGCDVLIEVSESNVVFIAISGTPASGSGLVAWEASVSDSQGVRDWLFALGLIEDAEEYRTRLR